MRPFIFFFSAFVLFLTSAFSQDTSPFTFALRAGVTSTSISRYDAGRMDESYSPLPGYEMGVQAGYCFNSWLAIRGGLSVMQRSHRMDRNLNYLDDVFTEHRNTYWMLPLMADFSFGGERLRGHLLTGGYGGYWLKEWRSGTTYWMTDYYVYFEDFDERRDFTDEDQRLVAGLSFGVAVSYQATTKLSLSVDAIYYYDLVSHHLGTPHLADPRYLNTLSLTLSLNYKL